MNVLMGHSPAKIDEKGRLKVPANFRKIIEDRYGSECFITSIDGERALVYPLAVWFEFQWRLAKVPSTSQAKQKLLERVNYFGQISERSTRRGASWFRQFCAKWRASLRTWSFSAVRTTSSSGTNRGSRSGCRRRRSRRTTSRSWSSTACELRRNWRR